MAKAGGGAATKQTAASKNGRLTKEQLLDQLKRRESEVEIADVGTILVQGLTLDDFGAIREMGGGEEEPNVGELFKKVVLLGCLDPSFDVDDLAALGEGDLATVTLIANEIMKLSGMLGKESASDFLADIQTSKGSSSSASESSEGSRAS